LSDVKSVLVTGASKGIGKAIAIELAKQGYFVGVHYLSDQAGAFDCLEKIKQNDGKGRLVNFDVSKTQDAKSAIEKDIETFGAYYGVVCNAGISRDTAFPAMSEQEWSNVIHTNLDAFYNVLHPCIMPMIGRKSPGRIVTLSSVSGITGNRGQVNYSASKAGIIGATKALAIELAKRQITVNCVAPGLINTGMLSKEIIERAMELIPMKRIGEPNEVANLVGFLMSDQAAYITRQVISVNGGMV
jgi:3-oxoacyl-[acyl-carrier protein] reductase